MIREPEHNITPEDDAKATAAAERAASFAREYRRPTTEEEFDTQAVEAWERFVKTATAPDAQRKDETIDAWRSRMANSESDHPSGLHAPFRTGLPADKDAPRKRAEPDRDGRYANVSRERRT